MTIEPRPKYPGDNDPLRKHMLDSIELSIGAEDYDFVYAIAGQQTLIRPFEFLEYMDVKRRSSIDPVEARKWLSGLSGYLDILSGQEFPEEEAEAIQAVTERLRLESAARDEVVTEVPTAEEAKNLEYPVDWDTDEFVLKLDSDTINQVHANPVFEKARRLAVGEETGFQKIDQLSRLEKLKVAKRMIQGSANSDLIPAMLKALNPYIFERACRVASGNTSVPRRDQLEAAHSTVKQYAFDAEERQKMFSALDKYVFEQAKAILIDEIDIPGHNRLEDAKLVIRRYASSTERRDAMLRHLH